MTSTERQRHARKRRHTVIATAVIAATITACADQPTPKPAATAGQLTDHDVDRLRALDPTPAPTKPPAAKPRAKPQQRHTPARIGTAVHITIPKVWARLVDCEASGHWAYGKPGGYVDAGYTGYEGGPNFVHQTWVSHKPAGYPLHAYDATPVQQIIVAKRVLRDQGVRAWPVCGLRVGLTMADAA